MQREPRSRPAPADDAPADWLGSSALDKSAALLQKLLQWRWEFAPPETQTAVDTLVLRIPRRYRSSTSSDAVLLPSSSGSSEGAAGPATIPSSSDVTASGVVAAQAMAIVTVCTDKLSDPALPLRWWVACSCANELNRGSQASALLAIRYHLLGISQKTDALEQGSPQCPPCLYLRSGLYSYAVPPPAGAETALWDEAMLRATPAPALAGC